MRTCRHLHLLLKMHSSGPTRAQRSRVHFIELNPSYSPEMMGLFRDSSGFLAAAFTEVLLWVSCMFASFSPFKAISPNVSSDIFMNEPSAELRGQSVPTDHSVDAEGVSLTCRPQVPACSRQLSHTDTQQIHFIGTLALPQDPFVCIARLVSFPTVFF